MEESALKTYEQAWIFLSQVALGSMLIPIIMAMLFFKTNNKALKVFFYFLIVSFVIALGEQLVYQFLIYLYTKKSQWFISLGIENMNFYNILFVIKNYVILGYFFFILLKPRKISTYFYYASLVLLSVSLINYFFIQGPLAYNSFNSTAIALFNFIIPIVYMWVLYHTDSKVPLSKNPYFWINWGLIIPNLLGLFIFFAGDKINSTDYLLYVKIMIGQSIIAIASQILYSIGFSYGRYAQFLRQ